MNSLPQARDHSYRSLFFFSLPTILSSLLEPLTGVVDTALVGQLSTPWLASLAFCTTLLNSLTWVFSFIVHASTQSISAQAARGNQKEGDLLAGRVKICFFVALALGFFSSLTLLLLHPWPYFLVGAGREHFPLMDDYYIVRVLGFTLAIVFITSISILRGLGRVKVCLLLLCVTTISNISLSYLFVYTFNFGFKGVAWGSVLSHLLGCIFGFTLIYRGQGMGKKIGKARPPKEQWFRFGKNSLNLFGRSAALTLCFFLATRFAARLGVPILGAHQILLQLWLLMSFFQDGLAITGNMIGAHFFGQKNVEKARPVFRKLLHLSGMISLGFTLIYFFGRDFLLQLFTQDPAVLLQCEKIWPLIWMSLMVSGFAFVYDGILFGLEGFAFLRKHILLGTCFIILPLMVGSWLWDSFFLLWLGLILLNIYRALSGRYYLYKSCSIPLVSPQ